MELLEKINLAIQSLEPHSFKTKIERGHLNILIVADYFDGMSLLKRQQKVLSVVKEYVSSGEVHAVNIKALTPNQYKDYLSEGN